MKSRISGTKIDELCAKLESNGVTKAERQFIFIADFAE